MQVLKTYNIKESSDHVRIGRTDFAEDCVYLGRDYDIAIKTFNYNNSRDLYLNQVIYWITHEIFAGENNLVANKLEINKFCEVSNDNHFWYKLKLLAVLPEKFKSRYIVEEQDGSWTAWSNARPIGGEPTIEGEIYTWEDEQ